MAILGILSELGFRVVEYILIGFELSDESCVPPTI